MGEAFYEMIKKEEEHRGIKLSMEARELAFALMGDIFRGGLKTFEQLEAQLKEANEVIGFYDCHRKKYGQTVQSWSDDEFEPKYLGEIPLDDFEILQEGSDSCNLFLGKRAREYQAKYLSPETKKISEER
jgi:hypothetical protein